MGRPVKKKIEINENSFLSIAQETYNELVEQRSLAVRTMNENKNKVEVEDMHDLVGLNKVNTDLMKLIDSTIDKKITLIKLMTQILYKNETKPGSETKNGDVSPQDIEFIREMLEDKDNNRDEDKPYQIKD
jgi:mannitol-1-phosphate/altronate dehydrogenase